MKFTELNLHEKVLEAIGYMGFEEATPVQEKTMPSILAGKDIIGCAQTGTGKTAAFMLPVINKLAENPTNTTNTLVVCPTRELAIQIEQQIQAFSYFTEVSSISIYGGGDGTEWAEQKVALSQGTNIIVATPGKLISHLNLGYVDFSNLQHLILDEADRMLDMGFVDDILKIISFMPKERQSLLFSATMPPKIRDLAAKILKDPLEVNIAIAKPAEGVLQAAYLIYNHQKIRMIDKLISGKENYEAILIFSSTKRMVGEIVRELRRAGHKVHGISSDLEQSERENVLMKFKAKRIRVLIATDVLSRGIDIKDINLVINFDVPNDAQDYVHRVGRTARANTTGVALTLINPDDMYKFDQIEQLIDTIVPKPAIPTEFGEAPEWNPKFRKKGGGGGHRKGGGGRSRNGGKGAGNRRNSGGGRNKRRD